MVNRSRDEAVEHEERADAERAIERPSADASVASRPQEERRERERQRNIQRVRDRNVRQGRHFARIEHRKRDKAEPEHDGNDRPRAHTVGISEASERPGCTVGPRQREEIKRERDEMHACRPSGVSRRDPCRPFARFPGDMAEEDQRAERMRD